MRFIDAHVHADVRSYEDFHNLSLLGAKAIWMQEGIINELAGSTARNAGLNVVMDTCMRSTHRRLMKK